MRSAYASPMTSIRSATEPSCSGSVSAESERLVLQPVGELDHFSARTWLAVLNEHLLERHSQIVLDLTGLSFCDSSGVSLAKKVRSLAEAVGIGFELRRSQSHSGRVFDLLPV